MISGTISSEKFYNFLDNQELHPEADHCLFHGIQVDHDLDVLVEYSQSEPEGLVTLRIPCEYVALDSVQQLARFFDADSDCYGVEPDTDSRVILLICGVHRSEVEKIDPDFEFQGLPKEIEISVYVDKSCEMAAVSIENDTIMTGNFWDFYPECYGIKVFGDFGSYTGLAFAVQRAYEKKGHKAKVTRWDAEYADSGDWTLHGKGQPLR